MFDVVAEMAESDTLVSRPAFRITASPSALSFGAVNALTSAASTRASGAIRGRVAFARSAADKFAAALFVPPLSPLMLLLLMLVLLWIAAANSTSRPSAFEFSTARRSCADAAADFDGDVAEALADTKTFRRGVFAIEPRSPDRAVGLLESDWEWPRVRISRRLVPELLAPKEARRGERPPLFTRSCDC